MGRFRAGLTSSMTCSSCHYLHTVLPFTAPMGDYSGRAAILSRTRAGPRFVPSHPPLISPVAYRLALPLPGARPCRGRSRTFTGQCCQPFCPGDAASHVDGPWIVTKYRSPEGRIGASGLRPARELGPPSAAETRHLPDYLPLTPPSPVVTFRRWFILSFEVRGKISERAWTRTGRI